MKNTHKQVKINNRRRIVVEANFKGTKMSIQLDTKAFNAIKDYDCTWTIRESRPGMFYAVGRIGGKSLYMHRVITGASKGQIVDHIDRNTLNNASDNLRVAGRSINTMNARVRSKKYPERERGVTFTSEGRKRPWRLTFKVHGKWINVGYFETLEAANEASREYQENFWKNL